MSKIGQAFANKILEYCNDDTHGYSQANRWGPDYDCSSLTYQVAYDLRDMGYNCFDALPTSGTRYTGTIVNDFCNKCGWSCKSVPADCYDIPVGSLCLNVVNHVMTYIGGGKLAGARLDQDGRSGDSSGQELETQPFYSYPWDYIITPPETGGAYYTDILTVDGYWGSNSTLALQSWFDRYAYNYTNSDIVIDGIVSGQYIDVKTENPGLTTGWEWTYNAPGSTCIQALQRMLKNESTYDPGSIDGVMGYNTICSLQAWLNCDYIDGSLWECSPCIMKLQEWLNNVR